MGEKKKKSFELGFFFRHEFKEQLRRMQTVAQVMEVLDAASDYVMTDNYSIQDPFSDLAFSAWKPCLKYEKETYLQVCEQNKINRQKREEKKIKKQQPELFKEEAASEGENVPLFEAVEIYPFEAFWREYISHKDEKNARIIWKHLSNDLRKKAINGARIYTQYVLARKSKDPKFDAILKSSTFLKDAHWNDEYKEEELTPQNYGNNNKQYNNREAQRQQNLREMGEWLAEAAANVQPINPTESGI